MASERTARLAQTNFWNELIALRDRQRPQMRGGVQVAGGDAEEDGH